MDKSESAAVCSLSMMTLILFDACSNQCFGESNMQCVGFEVLTTVVSKVSIFWDIALCSQYVNRRFGGTYHLYLQDKNQESKKSEF
jgi:hypothetical protein